MRLLILLVLMIPASSFANETYVPIVNSETFFYICGSALDTYDRAKAAGKGKYDAKSMAECVTFVGAYLSGYHKGVFSSAAKMASKKKKGEREKYYNIYSSEFLDFCIKSSKDEMYLIRPIMNYFRTHENSIKERLDVIIPKAYKQAFPCGK